MRLRHTPGMEMQYTERKTARPCLKSIMKHVKKVGHSCHSITYAYFTALIIRLVPFYSLIYLLNKIPNATGNIFDIFQN